MKNLTKQTITGRKWLVIALTALAVFAVMSCSNDNDDNGPDVPPALRTYGESVKKVIFTGDTATVNFTNLYGNDIYLIKINTSEFGVPREETGGIVNAPAAALEESSRTLYEPESGLLRRSGHPAIDRFMANPPPINRSALRSLSLAPDFTAPKVGDKRNFWVEVWHQNGDFTSVEKEATLLATGAHGNIWVTNENIGAGSDKNRINAEQAQKLSDKFDLIYPLTTNIFGYEFGGGPGGGSGRDGDPKIQILVCDILDEYGNIAISGYFGIYDFYTQGDLDRWGLEVKTNQAEIFYLDASNLNLYPDYIYSALIHELQHMINFNVKYVEKGINQALYASWYNEMLSMAAGDIIGPLIGVGHTNPDHPINYFIPNFLDNYYRVGITEWYNDPLPYAIIYAFGAYLVRNYGGAELLKRISANDYTGINSITAALKEFDKSLDFEQALLRYGEALMFSGSRKPEGALTFDKTVSSTINGKTYTAHGFDIWNMSRYFTEGGPVVFSLNQVPITAHSLTIHSSSQWKNRTGAFSATLEKPTNEDITLFMMVR